MPHVPLAGIHAALFSSTSLYYMKLKLIFLLIPGILSAQSYTSYLTGSQSDLVTVPAGGVCLMGGATEDDNAMRWFLQRANGGDILVLRASGSDGYNDYLYNFPGVSVNSVETIVCNNASASNSAYIHQKINQAEAVWFAGGDQWKYISYWRGTAVDSLINLAILKRNIVIGGTSAGMAIQGHYYFSATNGTVTSPAALNNPFDSKVTVDSIAFIENELLEKVITDTHFDNPDRRGRLCVFLARMLSDYGIKGRAIACDEYTAVCVDTNGIARVFGGAPLYEDNAFFIQVTCEINSPTPENCTPGQPLTWNLDGKALKVCKIRGDANGTNTFNLNDWISDEGGDWLDWSIQQGILNQVTGSEPACIVANQEPESNHNGFYIYPNPANDYLVIRSDTTDKEAVRVCIFDGYGRVESVHVFEGYEDEIPISFLKPGVHFASIMAGKRTMHTRIVKN